jgi:hypothetical protein
MVGISREWQFCRVSVPGIWVNALAEAPRLHGNTRVNVAGPIAATRDSRVSGVCLCRPWIPTMGHLLGAGPRGPRSRLHIGVPGAFAAFGKSRLYRHAANERDDEKPDLKCVTAMRSHTITKLCASSINELPSR